MIKYPDIAFDTHLKNPLTPIYLCIGQGDFLLNQAVLSLKKAFRAESNNTEVDMKRFYLEHTSDWHALIEATQSYSLFHDKLIIDASWQKKSFDTKTKNMLKSYIKNPSSHCLLLLRAPLLTAKSIADLDKSTSVTSINIQTLNQGGQINWIKQALKAIPFQYTDDIPKRIQAYTDGNLEAANQTIERLALMYEPNTKLTLDAIEEQLLDKRQYKLYEISGACLDGNPKHAIALTKRAKRDHIEPIRILWLISQELRLLEQILSGISYQALNIYSFRTAQYQRAKARLSSEKIYQLIEQSQALDTHIKSGRPQHTWILLEQLILAFSN